MRNILFRTSLIVSLVLVVSVPAFAQMKIGDSPTSITTGAQLDIEKSGSRTVFMDTGKVGIGDTSPASLLTVGSGDLFQVDSTGNIVKINNVTTSFPSSQGSAGTILTNNGSGTLTWSAPAGISADSLNFTDFSDSLLLDASTDIFASGTNVLSVTNSGTGLSFRVNDDGTTTDSTPFVVDASGNVGIADSTPASLLTVGSGDLFQVNSSGNIVKLNNVTTSFPGSQGAANSVLKNDGAGTLSWGPSEGIELTRTLPTVVNDIVEIGNFIQSNGGHNIRISVTIASGGFSESKSYIISSGYNTTGGAWKIANPITSSMAYSTNDFDLDVNSDTTFTWLRLRRTGGSTAATAYVRIESTGVTTDTFNSTSATGSVAAPTTYYTPLTQDLANSRVGIGTQSPNALLDVNGVLGVANGDLASGGAIRFRKADNSAWDGGIYETNGNHVMVHAGAANSIVLRDSSSNYGAWFNFGGNGFTFYNNYDDAASRGALTFYRYRSSATAPAAGFGTFLDFNLEGYTNGSQVGTGRISSIWENTQTNDTTDRDAALTFSTTADNSSAEQMRISSAGKVGIGTASPAGKVQVVTTSDTTPSTVTAWDARHLTVGATGSTGGGVGISYDQTNNRGYISALTPNTAWRDIIIGAGTANVGIGMTTAPAAKLTVSGGDILLDNGKKVYMASTTNGAGYFFDGSSAWGLGAYNSGSNYYTDIMFDSTGGSGSNSRGIRLKDWNGSAVRLFVGDTGNVGVGTSSPNAKLSIANNVATGFLDNYSEYQIITYDGGTAGSSFGQGVIANTMVFNSANGSFNFDKNGTSTQMSLDNSGNLVVAGTIKATNFGTSSATTLCHTANIIALCTSSARYKENIQNLTEGMDVIKKLRPVSFKWKVRDENSVGFIAEDVQKVDPRLTFNNDKGQVEGVHYQLITSYLTKAMQELSVTTDQNTADIKELKKENADMKVEISDLKTRLESLEQKLK